MTPGLPHYLALGAVLFAFGAYTVVTRTNAIGVLLGVELVLNAAGLNFVAFQRYQQSPLLEGHVAGLMVIVIAAAEAAVALAIVLALFARQKNIDVSDADTLRD